MENPRDNDVDKVAQRSTAPTVLITAVLDSYAEGTGQDMLIERSIEYKVDEATHPHHF